jgi:hypothetical protein
VPCGVRIKLAACKGSAVVVVRRSAWCGFSWGVASLGVTPCGVTLCGAFHDRRFGVCRVRFVHGVVCSACSAVWRYGMSAKRRFLSECVCKHPAMCAVCAIKKSVIMLTAFASVRKRLETIPYTCA